MLTGENGIIRNAQNAKNRSEESEIEEQIKLAVIASKIDTENFKFKINLEKKVLSTPKK